MSSTTAYAENDALMTYRISINIRNAATEMKMDEIRKKIDVCDDYQMRECLARQLNYLRSQLVKI